MKKWVTFLISVILLIGSIIPVYAATDPVDNLSALTEKIITTSNDLFSNELGRKITADDVDFNNAVKIYVGTNIFETNVSDLGEISDTFGADGYIYELPIYLDGSTLIVNIAKGQSLSENVEFTDRERQEVLANVGKWQVTAVKYYANKIINYATELENKVNGSAENAVLVGGLPYFKFAVALLADDNGKIRDLVPMSNVPGIENINSLQSDTKDVYKYKEVKAFINQLPPLAEDEAGAYGFLNLTPATNSFNCRLVAYGAGVLLIISIGMIIIYRKKIR